MKPTATLRSRADTPRQVRPYIEWLESRYQPGEAFGFGLLGGVLAGTALDLFSLPLGAIPPDQEFVRVYRSLRTREVIATTPLTAMGEHSVSASADRAATDHPVRPALVQPPIYPGDFDALLEDMPVLSVAVQRPHSAVLLASTVPGGASIEAAAAVGAWSSATVAMSEASSSVPIEPDNFSHFIPLVGNAPRLEPNHMAFDPWSGVVAIRGDGADHTLQETLSARGFVEISLDGQPHSSDPASTAFDPLLAGATAARLTGIRLDGAGGQDTLILGTQQLAGGLQVNALGAKVVTEDVAVGGQLTVQAADITVRGALRGSAVTLAATGWVSVEDTGTVVSGKGDAGGRLAVFADKFVSTGQLHADGAIGGQITVAADNVLNAGSITADGSNGGGTVRVAFTGAYIDTVAAMTAANSSDGPGGHVTIEGGTTGRLFSSGRQQATGSVGGAVDLLGREVVLDGGAVDTSGENGGGSIRVGGDFHGSNPAVVNADAVTVSAAVTLRADALRTGDGGRVAVWANGQTTFDGTVSARGGPRGGAGGFIEVSGQGNLNYGGTADAGALRGKTGTLLLDPKNLIISATPVGVFPQFDLIDPHPTAGGGFGTNITALSNGNVVVTNPNDDFGASNAGAVYLFDGLSGVLISSLIGSDPNDAVGRQSLTLLTNGNYLISDPIWNDNRGAATWASGSRGVSGPVSAGNSLVGSNPGDRVGDNRVTPLSNGNYLVDSSSWNSARGAVTWGNGITGVAGFISETNSLIGSNPGDGVGIDGVVPLSNGNYVVRSPSWNDGRGAATWGNGTTGITGIISAANSLVSSTPNVYFLGSEITPLSNGNYVVANRYWNGNRGAVTWGSGTTGVAGIISEANSLVGSNPGSLGDQVGSVTPLPNGNYVVRSPYWNSRRGAATWGNGTTGVTGIVSAANSLVGSNLNDSVSFGSIVLLSNGNYVIRSELWNDNRGAVTWANGTTGVVGVLSEANSLVGSNPGDGVSGVLPLTNGNYVVGSPFWNSSRGAVTWANGATGRTGTVSAANSLTGSNPRDQVGSGLLPLRNGNYVVVSQTWNSYRGAVTWGDGTTEAQGIVSAANSLVGGNPNDFVGYPSVVPLSNGNYVVQTRLWNGNRGAVTWGDGTVGVRGILSAVNSLVGVNFGDLALTLVTPLSNGNYVVASPDWNGRQGAVTWNSGTLGVTGIISTANSLIGSNPDDRVGNVTPLANGNYVVASPDWNGNRGAVTWSDGTTGVTGIVSEVNSLIGANPGDYVGGGPLSSGVTTLANGNYLVQSPSWNDMRGAVTWGNGTTGQTLDGKGIITMQNSLVGRTANGGRKPIVLDPNYQAFLVSFPTEGTGRVTIGLTDPNQFTYARAQSQTVTLTPDFLTATLNTGTAVVLQASNDITVDDPITVHADGHGGALMLQAGRGILLNASITTDNGPLTLIANDTRANGVVDSQRDPGNATIVMAGGTTLDTGTAPLDIELRDGAGLSHADSRAINLQTLTAGSVTVVNNGPDAGSDLRLGAVTTRGSQSYSSPHGVTTVTADLTTGDAPVTFTDSVVINDDVSINTGSGTVNFAGASTQTLYTGAGVSFTNLNHTGSGTVQLTSGLAVAGTFLQSAGTFDANDQPVTVGGTAIVTGGTYLAGIAPQTFMGGLVLTDGTFTSSTGPMTVTGGVTLTGGAFEGVGTVDQLTVDRGTVAPSTTTPGVLDVAGAVAFNPLTTFRVLLDGTHAGRGYSRLRAAGPVQLGGSTLQLVLGVEPPLGYAFKILTAAAAGDIQGTFVGLPEGSIFDQAGYQFQITYQGGANGRSVVLTRLS